MPETLTRYDHLQIRDLIHGYMVQRKTGEPFERFFDRAKAELIQNLERRLQQVKDYSAADYLKKLS
jgi:hypothetical protein